MFTYLPNCGFEIAYSVTLLETDYLDDKHPEFVKEEHEGATPDNKFVTFMFGKLTINPTDSVLQGRTWSVFLTGNVAVNSTI